MIGFSPLGALLAVGVLAPNVLLSVFPPRTPLPASTALRVLRIVESTGQALCMAVPVLTVAGPVAWWWAVPAASALAVYYGLWARYLVRRTPWSLYQPLVGVPVPMAIAPVLVFLAGAAWLSNPWIAGAALVLAAGHIPAALLIAGRGFAARPGETPQRGLSGGR